MEFRSENARCGAGLDEDKDAHGFREYRADPLSFVMELKQVFRGSFFSISLLVRHSARYELSSFFVKPLLLKCSSVVKKHKD